MSINKIIKVGFLLFFGITLQQLIAFLISIYAGKLLSVEEFGSLQILRSILGYTSLYSLGIPIALMYDLPKEIALKNAFNIKKNESLLFIVSLLSIVFLIPGGLFSALNFRLNGQTIGLGWIIASLIVIGESFRSRSTLLLRSYQSYMWLSYTYLIYPIILGIFGYFLTKHYKLEGFLWATFIASILTYLTSIPFINGYRSFSFDFHFIISKIKIGLPIKLGSLIWSFSIAGGLYIISTTIGPYQSGLYGFSMLCGTALMVLPTVIKEIFTPKIIAHFSMNEKNGIIKNEIIYWGVILFIFVGFVSSLLALIFFDYLIIFYLPKYKSAMELIVLFVIGYFLSLTVGFSGDYLILNKKQNIVFIFNIMILIIGFAAQLLIGYKYQNIYGIATSTALAIFLMNFIPFIYFIQKYTKNLLSKLIITIFALCTIMIPIILFTHNYIIKYGARISFSLGYILLFLFIGMGFTFFALKKLLILISE